MSASIVQRRGGVALYYDRIPERTRGGVLKRRAVKAHVLVFFACTLVFTSVWALQTGRAVCLSSFSRYVGKRRAASLGSLIIASLV
jgi:hypothetical protein